MSHQRTLIVPVVNTAKLAGMVRRGLGIALLAATPGMLSAEPFPSTLKDYVLLYELNSYEVFRHDSASYRERLKVGKNVMQRMKEHGGKSAEAATKEWFTTAAYSGTSLPGFPALQYLRDTKPVIADSNRRRRPATTTQKNTAESLLSAVAAISRPNESIAKTRGTDSVLTSGSGDFDASNAPVAPAKNVIQSFASKWWGGKNSSQTESRPAEPTPAASDAPSAEGPFAEIRPGDAGAFDEFASAGARQTELDESTKNLLGRNPASNVIEINGRIDGFNAAIDGIRAEMDDALDGDGSQLVLVIEKLESLADTQIGIQAMIDLSSPTVRENVGSLANLKAVGEQILSGINEFPDESSVVTEEQADEFADRVQRVLGQLSE